ncbi:dolichyl-diphosphooligosaccharide--protein glycosyltransferase subunit 4a [Quercus suber]|uniref:Dolichyl-diphosphooligosaccharide--protein glycosyltransferase subunit 4a n=1 Tax=Quercus suber TaxID=58331 RepID=A0AAW0LTK0_QUESU
MEDLYPSFRSSSLTLSVSLSPLGFAECWLSDVSLSHRLTASLPPATPPMIDDQDLGFFANFLGVFIFVLVIAYHYVVADPKYEGN